MSDGMIDVGSEFGKSVGFTEENFFRESYLWKTGDRIMISLVSAVNPGRGAFSELVKRIEALGLKVAVPTPLARMESILQKQGFVPHVEEDDVQGAVVVWMRPEQGVSP